MILSREALATISSDNWILPSERVFQLPEKVLQFGTGVLLRGLPDYFINKANNQGIFNGRVVIVKSTSSGGTNEFAQQDSLYTHCVRGIQNGQKVEENIINASVSRVLSAKDEWSEILKCAENQEMEVVISNTTEVGITLKPDDNIHDAPPVSFPGKLVAFLYKRFSFFNGDESKGMVIVPTELIPQNGKKLKAIILELANLNGLEEAFINWLESANHFCDSLVDRIVPGKLPQQQKEELQSGTGFTDELMIMSESYSLWAIEANDAIVAEKLSFSKADPGVVIAPDIDKFRELKLRLLNGTHTFSCGLAFLAGFTTVKQSMESGEIAEYMQQLMLTEIAPSIPLKIDVADSTDFTNKVLDRFRNPQIEHNWIAITVQYSSKMKLRNIPVLLEHYKTTNTPPSLMALGFAAHILFMKCVEEDGKYYGLLNGNKYNVQDDNAALYAHKWSESANVPVVQSVLSDKNLWDTDLTLLPGFADLVAAKLAA
ncbi:MAG TPA: tagaturonate reductase, partial [Segetibacter sp.]